MKKKYVSPQMGIYNIKQHRLLAGSQETMNVNKRSPDAIYEEEVGW